MNNEVRCPKCRSNQISANKKGFSGAKAVGGAFIAGEVGILAGTIGSNKIIITCLNCGHEFLPGHGFQGEVEPLNAEENAEKAKALDEEILRFCKAGQKLQAVKLYKDATGLGLKEAKNYVDYLSDQHLPKGSSAGNKGCAGAVLFFVAFVVIVVFILKG